jgi:hypothetical protein
VYAGVLVFCIGEETFVMAGELDQETILEGRRRVAAKVEFEGGLMGALESGLIEEDMPKRDTELRRAWAALCASWVLLQLESGVIDQILPDVLRTV